MKNIFLFFISIILFVSCDEIVEVTDISEGTVTILAPSDAITIATGSINFNWETVYEATDYQLQIATPTFANAISIIVDTTMDTNSYSTTLEVGEYEWRIKAINSNYETSYSTNSLTVN
jgi:hypothetical protein